MHPNARKIVMIFRKIEIWILCVSCERFNWISSKKIALQNSINYFISQFLQAEMINLPFLVDWTETELIEYKILANIKLHQLCYIISWPQIALNVSLAQQTLSWFKVNNHWNSRHFSSFFTIILPWTSIIATSLKEHLFIKNITRRNYSTSSENKKNNGK